VVGQPARLTLATRDRFGNACASGGEDVDVELHGPTGDCTPCLHLWQWKCTLMRIACVQCTDISSCVEAACKAQPGSSRSSGVTAGAMHLHGFWPMALFIIASPACLPLGAAGYRVIELSTAVTLGNETL
jgi:hypothetical protein